MKTKREAAARKSVHYICLGRSCKRYIAKKHPPIIQKFKYYTNDRMNLKPPTVKREEVPHIHSPRTGI